MFQIALSEGTRHILVERLRAPWPETVRFELVAGEAAESLVLQAILEPTYAPQFSPSVICAMPILAAPTSRAPSCLRILTIDKVRTSQEPWSFFDE